VLQVFEVPRDLVHTDPSNFRHGSLSVGCGEGSYTENDRQTITLRKINPNCQDYPKLALALPGRIGMSHFAGSPNGRESSNNWNEQTCPCQDLDGFVLQPLPRFVLSDETLGHRPTHLHGMRCLNFSAASLVTVVPRTLRSFSFGSP